MCTIADHSRYLFQHLLTLADPISHIPYPITLADSRLFTMTSQWASLQTKGKEQHVSGGRGCKEGKGERCTAGQALEAFNSQEASVDNNGRFTEMSALAEAGGVVCAPAGSFVESRGLDLRGEWLIRSNRHSNLGRDPCDGRDRHCFTLTIARIPRGNVRARQIIAKAATRVRKNGGQRRRSKMQRQTS